MSNIKYIILQLEHLNIDYNLNKKNSKIYLFLYSKKIIKKIFDHMDQIVEMKGLDALPLLEALIEYRPRETTYFAAYILNKNKDYFKLKKFLYLVKLKTSEKLFNFIIFRTIYNLLSDGEKSPALNLAKEFNCSIPDYLIFCWDQYAVAEKYSLEQKYCESNSILKSILDKADKETLLSVYQLLASNYCKLIEYNMAIKYYTLAINKYKKVEAAKEVLCGSKIELSKCYYLLGDHSKAISLLKTIIDDKKAPDWMINYAKRCCQSYLDHTQIPN